ncbi:hypothetical protein RKD49_000097 [Streptomyces glaucescens]
MLVQGCARPKAESPAAVLVLVRCVVGATAVLRQPSQVLRVEPQRDTALCGLGLRIPRHRRLRLPVHRHRRRQHSGHSRRGNRLSRHHRTPHPSRASCTSTTSPTPPTSRSSSAAPAPDAPEPPSPTGSSPRPAPPTRPKQGSTMSPTSRPDPAARRGQRIGRSGVRRCSPRSQHPGPAVLSRCAVGHGGHHQAPRTGVPSERLDRPGTPSSGAPRPHQGWAQCAVLGTLWCDYFRKYIALPAARGADPHSRVRELLAGRAASVPDAFDTRALAAATAVAARRGNASCRLMCAASEPAHLGGRSGPAPPGADHPGQAGRRPDLRLGDGAVHQAADRYA